MTKQPNDQAQHHRQRGRQATRHSGAIRKCADRESSTNDRRAYFGRKMLFGGADCERRLQRSMWRAPRDCLRRARHDGLWTATLVFRSITRCRLHHRRRTGRNCLAAECRSSGSRTFASNWPKLVKCP